MSAAFAITLHAPDVPLAVNDNAPLKYNGVLYQEPPSTIISLCTRILAYDARGNVTTLGSMGFIYDYSDQPVTVSGSANNVNRASGASNGNYRYDGNLKRVKSVVNGKTIYNVYNAAGRLVHVDNVATAKQVDYLYAGGMMIGRRDQSGAIATTHTDHLGGTVSQTDRAGNVQWRQSYSPFGSELGNTTGTNDRAGFTGHIKDSATGLNYMQARYYDPVIGRFLSVDPVTFLEVGIPAQFNRYSYTYNDPINNIDPDGQLTGKAIRFAIKGLKHKGNFKKAGKETLAEIGEALAELGDGDLSADDAAAIFDLFSPISTKDVGNAKKANDARKAARNRRSKNHRKNKRKSNRNKDEAGSARKDRDSARSDGVGGKGGSRKSQRAADDAAAGERSAREEIDQLRENIRNDNLPEP